MKPLNLADIQDIIDYERSRPSFRAMIINIKRSRRVAVGDVITFVFENRETVRFQIQEMARAERMTEDAQIRGELDAYNPLIPAEGSLSATLLVDITEQARIKPTLDALVGLHHTVAIVVDGARVAATFDAAQFSDNRISAVQYVVFPFTDAQRAAFCDPSVPASLTIDHPMYQHNAPLTGAVREALISDLS